MTAIVINENAKPAWLSGLASMRTRLASMRTRASDIMAYLAGAIMVCAIGAAAVQLAAEILSFPAPIAVTAMTLMAMVLLNSLRRHLRP
jgi:hypothetical protein